MRKRKPLCGLAGATDGRTMWGNIGARRAALLHSSAPLGSRSRPINKFFRQLSWQRDHKLKSNRRDSPSHALYEPSLRDAWARTGPLDQKMQALVSPPIGPRFAHKIVLTRGSSATSWSGGPVQSWDLADVLNSERNVGF